MYDDSAEVKEEVKKVNKVTKFYCEKCKSIFYSSMDSTCSKCCFCQSTMITKSLEELGKYPMLVPFNKSLDDALNDYKKRLLKTPFLPLVFRKKETINSLTKVYLPAVLANVLVEGSISMMAGDKENKKIDNEKCVETKKYQVVENVHIDYNELLFSLFNKIDDKVFQAICTYDYRFLQDYDTSIDDTCFIISNIEIKEIAEKARIEIMNHSLRLVKENVHHHLLKTENNDIKIEFNNSKEVFVPIYLLNVKYKDKDYIYLMNGQSGKSYLESVFGVGVIIGLSTIVFSIIFLISFLISYFI